MDFGLSDEQEMFQETVKGFLRQEFSAARSRELFDSGCPNDTALWGGLSEMGLAGLVIPEEFGGSGLDALEVALVSEALGAAAAPVPFLEHSLAARAIARAGSIEQKSRWLPGLAEGAVLGTVALGEEGGAWGPQSWKVRVEGQRIWGCQSYVSCAEFADLMVVGVEGGGLVVVERDRPGIKIQGLEGLDRTRSLSRVEFDGVPCAMLAAGPEVSRDVLGVGHVGLAADGFGAATRLLDATVEYAKTREQFGQSIAQFQAVKHQIARLGLEIEPTRALWWHAAYAVDYLPRQSERLPALAKAHVGDRSASLARMAVELHGGLGFTWECDVQIWLKRILFDRGYFGSPESLREECARLGGW